jgi:hypothetical protein
MSICLFWFGNASSVFATRLPIRANNPLPVSAHRAEAHLKTEIYTNYLLRAIFKFG